LGKPTGPIVGLVCSVLIATAGDAQSAEQWQVTEAQAICILQNLTTYADRSKRLVVIPVENCPETDLYANALSGKKNTGLATPRVKTGKKTSPFDKFITYTPQELECLRPEMVRVEDGRAYLPKKVPCP